MIEKLFDFLSKYIALSPDEASELIKMNLIKEYSKGEFLLREGEISKRSYMVLQGCIRDYYIIDGEVCITAFYTENDSISPNCVATGEPSEYYLDCLEDSILLVSTTDMEQSFYKKFPKFEQLCRVLSTKLLAKNRQSFDRYKNSSPEQRYLFLVDHRPELLQRVPQYQLASYLGIKPESLSRIRRRVSNANTSKKKADS